MFAFINKHKVLTAIVIIILFLGLILTVAIRIFSNESKLAYGYGNTNDKAINVSIINLIATPEKYDGKLVRVTGVGRYEFESNALFLSEEDYENNITLNAVSLDYNYDKLKVKSHELDKMNGDYVAVEGVFNSNNCGWLLSPCSGTIEKVSSYRDVTSTNLYGTVERLLTDISVFNDRHSNK